MSLVKDTIKLISTNAFLPQRGRVGRGQRVRRKMSTAKARVK